MAKTNPAILTLELQALLYSEKINKITQNQRSFFFFFFLFTYVISYLRKILIFKNVAPHLYNRYCNNNNIKLKENLKTFFYLCIFFIILTIRSRKLKLGTKVHIINTNIGRKPKILNQLFVSKIQTLEQNELSASDRPLFPLLTFELLPCQTLKQHDFLSSHSSSSVFLNLL